MIQATPVLVAWDLLTAPSSIVTIAAPRTVLDVFCDLRKKSFVSPLDP